MSDPTPHAPHDAAHAAHPRAGTTNYVKIWAILCGLLVVSVVGPMFEIPVLTLITAFGIACVKAYLVATRFMHLNVEKRLVPYMLGTMLALMALMVGAMSPDVMKHEGARWENTAAKHVVEQGPEGNAAGEALMDGAIPEPRRFSRRQPILPNGVMGMLIFTTAEIMFFAGMLSAFTIVRASSMPLMWPPLGQPRLPASATALNTVALLLSGVALYFAHRAFQKPEAKKAVAPLAISLALGLTFVALQGSEWVALLKQGLTMTSSNLGSFFYLIVGTHAAHAIVAICLLGWALVMLRAGKLKPTAFYTVQTFWYFVVGMWPVIYARVYF